MDECDKLSGVSYIGADISVCEMMGSDLHLHLLINDKKLIVRMPTLGMSDEDLDKFKDNRTVWITFPPESIHLFDTETKNNLIYQKENVATSTLQ